MTASRQIPFSGPMVRALLNGTKTQDRRIIKVPEFVEEASVGSPHWQLQRCGAGWEFIEWSTDYGRAHPLRCPYGQRGDRLWVRETHAWTRGGGWIYRADGEVDVFSRCRWLPSGNMPRSRSRITLEITDVRVEQLQDIREADAKAEGADPALPVADQRWVAGYRVLWEQIHGPGSWDANPWVWVLTFKRVEK